MRKPEAGDVYHVIGFGTYHIIKVSNNAVRFMDKLYKTYTTPKDWIKTATYLGKAKANINDLFEVQDD